MQNYAIYLKPTNLCNRRCWFCYDSHTEDAKYLKDPEKAFEIVDKKLFQSLFTKSGGNIQFVLHGGEFFLVGEVWLESFLKLLTSKYPSIQLCGMSNLSCKNFKKCYDIFRSYGGNIGTSYNEELFSDIWIENLNYVLKRQNNVNLNRVYLGETVDFSELYKTITNFAQSDNWTFKFERVVKDDINDLYQSSSQMMIQFIEWCLTKDHIVLKHFGVFLFCLLKFEVDRRFGNQNLKENIGNSLCDMRCCANHFVVDNALNIGKCTKYFKTTKNWEILDIGIEDVIKTEQYDRFVRALETKSCSQTTCKVYDQCVGGCKLSQLFDKTGECNNNRDFREYLLTLDDKHLLSLISKTQILSSYYRSLQSFRVY